MFQYNLMRKLIITGGPHTGKTTLLEGLREALPEAGFVSEPATSVLRQTGDFSLLDDPLRFCRSCIAWSLQAESEVNSPSGLVVQDRSLIDTVAYSERDGCSDALPMLPAYIGLARYTVALRCNFVGQYTQSDIRTEGYSAARDIHELLAATYRDNGVPVIDIPSMPVPNRVNYVCEIISDNRLLIM